jgi:uncharacterized protein YfaS (alpha-2-macroglobulin family)
LSLAGVPAVVHLDAQQRKSLVIPLSARDIGIAELSISLTHAGGPPIQMARSLSVNAANSPSITRRELPLAANGGRLVIDPSLLEGQLSAGASVSVGISSIAAFDVPALLFSLDHYPYGCAEQITSRALPLLYAAELGEGAGMRAAVDDHAALNKAISTLLGYQASNGSFGLWGPGSGDLWLDAYVSDFLTRAREAGYDIPAQAMTLALDNLQNVLAYGFEPAAQGSEMAYALYVLARNRRASISDLRYYSESRLDEFASPLARAQIGAGLALYGDREAAVRVFDSALSQARGTTMTRTPTDVAGTAGEGNDGTVYEGNTGTLQSVALRTDYGTALRDAAGMIALAAEIQPAPAALPAMIDNARQLRQKVRWTSTQDDAWMLLAARALTQSNANIQLELNGVRHQGGFAQQLTGSTLKGSPLTVVNSSDTPVQAVVTTLASPIDALPAGGEGFHIERRYYDLQSQEMSLSDVRQNQRVVVVLSIEEKNNWPSQLMVSSPLAAGFEIDNPRLVASAELPALPWLDAIEPAHSEYLDDRFNVAFTRQGYENRTFNVAYVMRAITPGNYAQPAATVEDMYRPQLSARTAASRVTITADR